MEKENEINLDELDQIETGADKKLQVRNRFQQLANEKNQARQEREQAEAKVKELEAKALQVEKESNFYKTFSQLSAKYPEATNYQEQILERVNKGYDQEEATLAVLAKEGKLGTQSVPPPPAKTPSAEGGSAITNVIDGEKTELSMSEKLEALKGMEKSGELQQALRAGINRS